MYAVLAALRIIPIGHCLASCIIEQWERAFAPAPILMGFTRFPLPARRSGRCVIVTPPRTFRAIPLLTVRAVPGEISQTPAQLRFCLFKQFRKGFLKLLAEYIVGELQSGLAWRVVRARPARYYKKPPIITPPHRCASHGLGDNAKSLSEVRASADFSKMSKMEQRRDSGGSKVAPSPPLHGLEARERSTAPLWSPP